MSDVDFAKIAQAAYDDATWVYEDVHAILVNGVLGIRGTTSDKEDWFRDIDFIPMDHPQLGTCDEGFLTGAMGLFGVIGPKNFDAIVGHSLGGALAINYGALMSANGLKLPQIVTFGSPRVGFQRLRDRVGYKTRQYRNGNDPVTEVPPFYQHVSGLIPIGKPDLMPISCHRIASYIAAL